MPLQKTKAIKRILHPLRINQIPMRTTPPLTEPQISKRPHHGKKLFRTSRTLVTPFLIAKVKQGTILFAPFVEQIAVSPCRKLPQKRLERAMDGGLVAVGCFFWGHLDSYADSVEQVLTPKHPANYGGPV